MTLEHPELVSLLQKAYSAEKAAAFAYIGHAGSIKDPRKKAAIQQIEEDEWEHRREVLKIMNTYDIPVSRFNELRFHIIGKVIAGSCYVIGWFMPYYFAGVLESGNVCEYFIMMKYFHELGIDAHDQELFDMGIKEKEHEVFFLEESKKSRMLPFFEKIFRWGKTSSFNDVDIESLRPVEKSDLYCEHRVEMKETIADLS